MLKTLVCNVHIAAVKSSTKKDRQLLNALSLNNFMKSASFIFNFDSDDEAKIVAKSLNPEIKHKIPKTNVEVNLNGKSFSLKIEANDISSLRAACNSYLRWINVVATVKKIV